MDKPKRISVRVDESVENFLGFIVRYFSTLFVIILHPLSPQKLLNQIDAEPPLYVRPLTFLAIGAFSFSLIINVFPKGLEGLIYIMWDADGVKSQIRDNWQQAFSLTTLLISGMPVIFSVVALSSLSGKFIFNDHPFQKKWFEINCYVFGFQSVSFLILFSLDTLLESVVIVVPWISEIKVSENSLSFFFLILLGLSAIVTLVWPAILLSTTFIKLKEIYAFRKKVLNGILIVLVYYPLGLFLYPGFASILPSLDERYFTSPEPSMSLVSFTSDKFEPTVNFYRLRVGLEITNPTSEDIVYALENTDFKFHWGESDTPPKSYWDLQDAEIKLVEPQSDVKRLIVPKNSVKKFVAELYNVELAKIACEVVQLMTSQDANIDYNSSNNAPLSTFNFIYELGAIKETLLIDVEDIFGLEFHESEKMQKICESKLN